MGLKIKDVVEQIFIDYVADCYANFCRSRQDENEEFILPDFDFNFCADYFYFSKEIRSEAGFKKDFLDKLYLCEDYKPHDICSLKKVLSFLEDKDFYFSVARNFFESDDFRYDFNLIFSEKEGKYILKKI